MASEFDFIVIMGASRSAKMMPRYLSQLIVAEIPYHVEPLRIVSPSDGTMGFVVDHFSRMAHQFSEYSRLVLTDAWDVMFWGDRQSLSARLSLFAPHVLFGAERNCYPEPHLADAIAANYQPTPSTPWRFLNGGCLTGSPAEIIQWCETVQKHPEYDPAMIGQQWLNRRLAENSPLTRIDFRTHLFYCLFREDEGNELVLQDGKPFNSLTGSSPLFTHFNGSWPPQPFLRMMGENV